MRSALAAAVLAGLLERVPAKLRKVLREPT
jgi:hypothetical protein